MSRILKQASPAGLLVPTLASSLLASPVEGKQPRGNSREARTDANGDPLPEGALVRIGSQRMRHSSMAIHLMFSPDGKELVSVGDDMLIRIWDPATGKELRQIRGHRGGVECLAFSPDGKTLA